MARLTYKEQLLHPNWQRKRLEVLEYYDFKCASCGATEKTLHVHHKHYVKGRQAWEYELAELEALCVDCHKDAHDFKERIDRVVANFPASMWGSLADILVGYGEEWVDDAEWLFVEGDKARIGRMAWQLGNFGEADLAQIREIFMRIGPDGFIEALRRADREGPDA